MYPTNVAIEDMKLCAGCKHVAVPYSRELSAYRCFHPQNFIGYSPLDGSRVYAHPKCADFRELTCGLEGNLWEAKPTTTIPAPMTRAVVQSLKLGRKINIPINLADL